ncbi:MAG TPA: RHS repeat-associated core domain-containing protein [Candidatus Babeliaceae bacterium]|nr:RHS repeat-associated core domain-containing protein [Candidatus Babeliaceae bacterium]
MLFDNMGVMQITGPVLEETHYYPYGLTMAGISTTAPLKLENRFKYNGKELSHQEFSDGNGLDWYSYGDREFDPQLGAFHTVDPYADNAFESSPYSYALNNPVLFIDINGDSTVPKNDVDWSSFDTQNNTVGLNEVDIFGGFDFGSLLYGGHGPLYTGVLFGGSLNFIHERTSDAGLFKTPIFGATNTTLGGYSYGNVNTLIGRTFVEYSYTPYSGKTYDKAKGIFNLNHTSFNDETSSEVSIDIGSFSYSMGLFSRSISAFGVTGSQEFTFKDGLVMSISYTNEKNEINGIQVKYNPFKILPVTVAAGEAILPRLVPYLGY